MNLSDAGESRVRGYLYVLERDIRSAVSPQLAADAVREVESHIRERVAESPGMPNEREALEEILGRLGAPGTVAKAYSLELMIEEASTGGRLGAVLRTLFRVAPTGLLAFVGAELLFIGYVLGISGIVLAILQPLFPANVGLWMRDGMPASFGARFPAPEGYDLVGGYWIIPLGLTIGMAVLLGTHAAARRWLASMRRRGAIVRQF